MILHRTTKEKTLIKYFTLITAFISLNFFSQNLIINPGFEDPEAEPKYQPIGMFDLKTRVEMTPDNGNGYTAGYVLSEGWSMPTNGTSDYLSGENCSAFGWPIMQARNGVGRGGFVLGGKGKRKEYLQVELTDALEKNKKYCLSFYIAHEKFSNYAISEVDAYFSQEKIVAPTRRNLNLTPHVSLNKSSPITHDLGWVEVCGTYIAKGGEKYLTVGNFNKNEVSVHVKELYEDYKENGGKQGFMHPLKERAYYYVDDFNLTKESDSIYHCEQWKIKDDESSKNWLFLVDASGSMASIDKLPNIKMEMQQIASIIPEGSTFSIVAFGSVDDVLLSGVDMSDTKKITEVLNNIKADGGSLILYSYLKTLHLAKEISKNGKPTEIFIFTDGAVSGGKAVIDSTINFRKKYSEIKVNTVEFGSGKSKNKKLVAIAEAGNGSYYNTQIEDLRTILQSNIGLELISSVDCSNFSDCCEPQHFIDQYNYNNTTFLLDVSSSMRGKDKLPLLQKTLINLSDSMRPEDKLSIVQFSGTSNVILQPTSYQNKEEINRVINHLRSNGNTNLEKGIDTAVNQAIQTYQQTYNNTIIIATDGQSEFTPAIRKSIKEAKNHNIHTSILHFSDYESKELVKIAKEGNGAYHKINDNNLWSEFSYEITRKEMGSDFYTYNYTYSIMNKKQISAYRWSKIMVFVTPVVRAAYSMYIK